MRAFRFKRNLDDCKNSSFKNATPEEIDPGERVGTEEEANLITSQSANVFDIDHYPVLDIDYAARLVPSSTPGHFHLYLDKPVAKDKYDAFLKAMAEAGLIQIGYYEAFKARGFTMVRKPGVTKPQPDKQEVAF